jgi:hypothetical protein
MNCEALLLPNILDPLPYVNSGALTSLVCASSAVLQLYKETQRLWRCAALEWHDVASKDREYQ